MAMRPAVRLGKPVLVVIAMILAACGNGGSGDEDTWGDDAAAYFDGLAEAYSENDYYGVLDFYDVEAFVEIWRGDNRGGMLVRDFIKWNSGDLGNTVRTTYLGPDSALTLVEWETSLGLSAVSSHIDNGLITYEVIYDQGAWLEQGFRSSPEVLAAYEDLYEQFAEVWIADGPATISDLYHPDAVLHDPLIGRDIQGSNGLEETRGWAGKIETMELSSVTVAGPRTGPAVFQGPSALGTDPERAVGLYEVTDSGGCVGQLAVAWELAGGLVVDETRFWGIGSFGDCDRALPDGWWSGLALPGQSDERVTGVIEGADGADIAVYNGTPMLEELVTAGLARFSEAGLEQPRFDSVTFEPSRSCETRSGRLLEDDGSRDIYMCLYQSDLCPGSGECVKPSLNVRSNVLHELGHAWILDNVDPADQELLLEVSGRAVWQSIEVPWSERGVEYAAEVISWGLLEETAPMVRIGRPSCDELEMAFETLTNAPSLFRAGTCPGL